MATPGSSGVALVGVAGTWRNGQEGVQDHGKAESGHKTMIDALIPAIEALQ